ncbi:MAG: GNAT family N-acetyltransferase [bacterium]|nr:GNAT family N-acetyltransferase [bacterium]
MTGNCITELNRLAVSVLRMLVCCTMEEYESGKSAIQLRPYEAGDERAINREFNRVFRTDRPLEEWWWKFRSIEGGRPIMVAIHDGELLAQYASVPYPIQVDGKMWSAAQIVDVFSTRNARRLFAKKGVWVQTVERFFDHFASGGSYPLLFGFPGRRALRLGILQLGYDAVEPQPIRYLSRRTLPLRSAPRRFLYQAEVLGDRDERLDLLWRRVRESYPVATIRDADRAQWRLSGHPTVTYHRFLVRPRFSDVPVAFAAFRVERSGCKWVDLLWDHRHPGALALLSHLGAKLTKRVGATIEEMWLNGDSEGKALLEQWGFVEEPEPNGLVMVARSFDTDLDVKALDGRVYITMSDSDLS